MGAFFCQICVGPFSHLRRNFDEGVESLSDMCWLFVEDLLDLCGICRIFIESLSNMSNLRQICLVVVEYVE